MKSKTRHEQYLRILTDVPSGESDYEAVKYLVDMGYTDSTYISSFASHNYGQAIYIEWLGANSNGIDYIDVLNVKITQSKSKNIQQEHKNNDSNTKPNGVFKNSQKYESKISWVSVVEAVIAAIVVASIFFFCLLILISISIKPNN